MLWDGCGGIWLDWYLERRRVLIFVSTILNWVGLFLSGINSFHEYSHYVAYPPIPFNSFMLGLKLFDIKNNWLFLSVIEGESQSIWVSTFILIS